MSVRRRPSLWSYFSFSSKPGTRYGRSDSVTSNLRHNDPYEKPNRHSSSIHGGMTQAGRARLIKIVSVVGLLLLGVWLFVPRDREKAEGIVGGM